MSQPIAWGMNCGLGPDGLIGAVEQAIRLTTFPLIVEPNAGMPKEVENRRIYLCSPEYLASTPNAMWPWGVGRRRLLRHHAGTYPRWSWPSNRSSSESLDHLRASAGR